MRYRSAIGTSAALSGALLARSSPSSSPTTRARFAWVERPLLLRGGVKAGFVMVGLGLALDLMLFFVWVASPGVTEPRRLALGALAQGLILTGAIFVAVITVYRLMLDELRHPVTADRASEA